MRRVGGRSVANWQIVLECSDFSFDGGHLKATLVRVEVSQIWSTLEYLDIYTERSFVTNH